LKNIPEKMDSIDLFKIYITGDFDNKRQIADEIKMGNQIHPLAVHVNRIADYRIKNAPKVNGFWILEESYYTKPGQEEVEIKPYLFLFEAYSNDQVKLTPYSLPENLDKKEIKNDNPELFFDFNQIKPSPSFKPAFYTRKDNHFYIHAPNDLPNGMKFTLTETISATQLIVMELLEKEGKRLTPYDTPIVYDRVKYER
jgi:hypothetical protein